MWRRVVQRETQDLFRGEQISPLAHSAKEPDRFHERDVQSGCLGQTRQHGLDFRPALAVSLDVQGFADRAEKVIVEVMEAVQTTIARLQVIAKAVRFARFQEGEHGAFILRELAEKRAQDQRGERVQRVATREKVAKLSLGHVLRSKSQLPRLLAEDSELFLTLREGVGRISRPPAIGTVPRR